MVALGQVAVDPGYIQPPRIQQVAHLAGFVFQEPQLANYNLDLHVRVLQELRVVAHHLLCVEILSGDRVFVLVRELQHHHFRHSGGQDADDGAGGAGAAGHDAGDQRAGGVDHTAFRKELRSLNLLLVPSELVHGFHHWH